ncbi:hypothetical protein TNCV_4200301 [Trichonephila clavipes]|uniref:Uncharacterized protein n=1 Tax=Trichonephila clavipes TaxID=2585209 RepID=A0A8X6WCS8_TRICX|nr:hypothetical protein TNCV_4200301 [Trichonephila clavipes]
MTKIFLKPTVAEWLAHRTSTPQVRVQTSSWIRLTQPFIPSAVRSKTTELAWGLNTGGFCVRLIRTSAHAPQGPRSRILCWVQ